ncbi:hypothetical protein ACWDUL_14510 [Nocardia niigatensis]|uniref:hypothetical protein n=1 Tax=Nocardia niigatensis TaxID=209249 RepID=UPI0002FDE454|nr:hypothetical protein [Nocardia niigatensis]
MTDAGKPSESSDTSGSSPEASDSPRPAERRAGSRRLTPAERARLARIFGDELPSTTRDERTPEPESGRSSEEWLRSQVPPHHG